MASETEKVVTEALGGGKKKKAKAPEPKYLNTGVTLLNLELTGTIDKGIAEGTVVLLAGLSSSGKTWLGEQILAEASIDPRFDGYVLENDDPEHGSMLLDKERFFGPKLFKRLVTRHSPTVEDYYYNLDDRIKSGQPFISLLDSMDALDAKKDQEHFQKLKAASRKAKKDKDDEKGSYKTHKQRTNSANLRTVCVEIPKTGSIALIISQVRTNIGYGAQFNPHVVTGGIALEFYPHYRFRLSGRDIKVVGVNKKKVIIGTQVTLKIEKNRSSGRKSVITFPLYNDTGIDDVGACVDYLIDQGHWEATGKKQPDGTIDVAKAVIHATEFEAELKRDELIPWLEETEQVDELRGIVKTVWETAREAVRVERKPRYGQ